MISSRTRLVWKISGWYLVTSGLLHLILVIALWGYAKALLVQLAVEVPSVTPFQIQEIAGKLSATATLLVLAILVVMVGVSVALSLRIANFLNTLSDDAKRIAIGDARPERRQFGYRELDELSLSIGQMFDQLDQRIRHAAQQGKEREAIFASMVEGVIAVDAEQRIIELNRAAYSLCGIPENVGVGSQLEAALPMPEIAELIRAVPRSKQAGGSLVLEFRRELDGAPRVLEVQATPLSDATRATTGTVLVLHDVSELRQLERIRQDFVANVSHELRTPITSIQGFVETLLEGALTDPRVSRRFVEIIRKHAERLRTLIDDLLTLARVEEREERGELTTELVPIGELLQSVADWCTPLARDKGISLAVESAVDAPVRVNRSLFEQALINLVENAIKFTESSGVVTILAREHQSGIVFAVRDTGIGIEKEHLPRVFERFYRADRSRSRNEGGTGLGLAIVKHIVRAHGGEIEVESQVGKGSTFTLRMPEAGSERKVSLG